MPSRWQMRILAASPSMKKRQNFNVNLTLDASLVKVRPDLFALPEATSEHQISVGSAPGSGIARFCVLVTLSATLGSLSCVWQQCDKDFWTRPDASLNVTFCGPQSAGLSLVLPAPVNVLVFYREFSARKYRHRETSPSHEYVGVAHCATRQPSIQLKLPARFLSLS